MRKSIQFDLDSFVSLPPGTLGYELAHFLHSQNLNPNFYPQMAVNSDADYIKLWLRQTHDIWHVVTGFDASVEGELGLQALQWTQVRSPVSVAIILAGLLGTFMSSPTRLLRIARSIVRGLRLGRTANSFFPVPWDEMWSYDLATIRRMLRVEASFFCHARA